MSHAGDFNRLNSNETLWKCLWMETNPHSPLKSHSFVRKSRWQRQRFPRIVTETSNSSRIIDCFGWGLSIVALTDGRTGGFDWVSFWNTQHFLTNWRRGRITIHYHFFCFCFYKMKSVKKKKRIWNDRFFPDPHLNEIFLPALSSSSSATTTTWRAVLMMFCFRFGYYFSLVPSLRIIFFVTGSVLSLLTVVTRGSHSLALSLFLSNQPELGAPSIVVIFSVLVTTTLHTTYYYYHDRHQYGSFVRQLLVL